MKTLKILVSLWIIAVSVLSVSAQKTAKPKPMIFAVLNDGKTLEPIVFVENGKLVETGDGEANPVKEFVKNYYKPQTSYNLIFGGIAAGKVTVKKGNAETECAANLADVTSVSSKVKLKGLVMGLATNAAMPKNGSGVRRMPTPTERTEIEKLVRAEFIKQKVSTNLLKILHSFNLTALDIDNDGKAELVGSYWVANKSNERTLLFFIAEKGKSGKFDLTYQEVENFTPDKVMSGEVKALDSGIYSNLLLDVFDYDGDGSSEIFTIKQAFEGNNFFIYKRDGGKWTKVLETYNYHCAY